MVLGSALVISALMMATTSTEMGGLFARHQGHKIAQAYGMFLWAGVVLYVATAWRVRVEGRVPAAELGLGVGPTGPTRTEADLVLACLGFPEFDRGRPGRPKDSKVPGVSKDGSSQVRRPAGAAFLNTSRPRRA